MERQVERYLVGLENEDIHGVRLVKDSERLRIFNEEKPKRCNECGSILREGEGREGEDVLFCPEGCGVKWQSKEVILQRIS